MSIPGGVEKGGRRLGNISISIRNEKETVLIRSGSKRKQSSPGQRHNGVSDLFTSWFLSPIHRFLRYLAAAVRPQILRICASMWAGRPRAAPRIDFLKIFNRFWVKQTGFFGIAPKHRKSKDKSKLEARVTILDEKA